LDISIVSGTYNRLPYLQKMVISVRNSLAGVYGLAYEIVLVDGGSTDTTQEWCKMQSDIRLIEHGKLVGAVKAFNDGAYAATGKYVIMANDDIEFVDNSILVAYAYMETHPNCGGGCFYQDRNERARLARGWYAGGEGYRDRTKSKGRAGPRLLCPGRDFPQMAG
jgi:GT2 family glycosyltransferase